MVVMVVVMIVAYSLRYRVIEEKRVVPTVNAHMNRIVGWTDSSNTE